MSHPYESDDVFLFPKPANMATIQMQKLEYRVVIERTVCRIDSRIDPLYFLFLSFCAFRTWCPLLQQL